MRRYNYISDMGYSNKTYYYLSEQADILHGPKLHIYSH